MSRPIGVTLSAIVAILGSIFTLLIALAGIASLFIEPPQSQARAPNSELFAVAGAVMFATLAAIGFWTSAGLFRLRPWARTSILVFAGLMAVGCIFGLLVTLTVPIPSRFSGGTAQQFRLMMAIAFGIPLVIAVWWLVQFNSPFTKAAFASPIAETASARPLSITIIAWGCIIGGATSILAIFTRSPVLLLGALIEGWMAGVIQAVFAALSLFIGKGLLELREEARLLAIGWFVFWIAHWGVVTFVPPVRQRMLEVQRGIEQQQPSGIPFDLETLTNLTFALSAIITGIAIWFLIRHRALFGQPTRP